MTRQKLHITREEVIAFTRPIIRETANDFEVFGETYSSLAKAAKRVGNEYTFIPYGR